MKKIIKTFILVAVVAALVFVGSCGKKKSTDSGNTGDGGNTDGGSSSEGGTTTYTITYELNGGSWGTTTAKTTYDGTTAIALIEPVKDGSVFDGWYDNKDFTGSEVKVVKKGTTGNLKFYAKWREDKSGEYEPKWELNSIGFDGAGMKVLIKVLPVEEFDPFQTGYTGSSQTIKQAHMVMVEKAYNIDLVYSAWDNEASWGPERVNFIKTSYADSSFKNNNVYIVNITSQWIPTLYKSGCLAELYNVSTSAGIFADMGYEQNSTLNEAFSVGNRVYGYSTGSARPDYFLYYNSTLIQSINMEDPAELWFKGEWTWSTFDKWVRDAQTKLATGEYAVDAGYAPFSIGAVAAQGNKFVNAKTGLVVFTKSAVTNVFDSMKEYYNNGYWNKNHGVQDVSTDFVAGKTIFQDGSLWYLKETTRFAPWDETEQTGCNFVVGVVPYPMADDSVATPYTEPYQYYDTEGNMVKVDEPLQTVTGETLKTTTGDSIYGIDLSSSTFKVPYVGSTCYSVMNFYNGSVTPTIITNILNDLEGALGKDPNQDEITADEGYRIYLETKLDCKIFVDAVMSVQSSDYTYYELMEVLSMTVGSGSHYGPDAFWPLASGIMTSEDTPAIKLKSVEQAYQDALEYLGY